MHESDWIRLVEEKRREEKRRQMSIDQWFDVNEWSKGEWEIHSSVYCRTISTNHNNTIEQSRSWILRVRVTDRPDRMPIVILSSLFIPCLFLPPPSTFTSTSTASSLRYAPLRPLRPLHSSLISLSLSFFSSLSYSAYHSPPFFYNSALPLVSCTERILGPADKIASVSQIKTTILELCDHNSRRATK